MTFRALLLAMLMGCCLSGCYTLHSLEVENDPSADDADTTEESADDATEPETDNGDRSSTTSTVSTFGLVIDFLNETIRDSHLREDLEVAAVLDAYTVRVQTPEGETYILGLICVEAIDAQRMEDTLRSLLSGKTVRFERDAEHESPNAKNRNEGYIFVGGLNVNAELVRRGAARYLGNSSRYAGEFDKITSE